MSGVELEGIDGPFNACCYRETCIATKATVDDLRAQLEAAERLVVAVEVQAEENFRRAEAAEADAARYKWLRENASIIKVTSGQVIGYPSVRLYESIHGPDFRGNTDAAIDAAMFRTKEETN